MKTLNRSIIVGSMLLAAAGSIQAQNVAFSCDFEQGIPETFATFDRDGNDPSRSMKKYGFENGIAWVGYTIEPGTDKQNGMACSGSWYTDPATSDDWLITPAIAIDSKYNILSWRAYAMDAEHRDGYAVYISTSGNTPDDFTQEAIFSTDAESPQWTTHTISLERWAGQEIYIAFVNNSTNCNILAIDDLNIFAYDHTFDFVNTTPLAIASPGVVNVEGRISPSGFLPVEGYKAELVYNGETYTIDHSDLVIAPGEVSTFAFDVDIDVKSESTEVYTLTISALNGEDTMVKEGSVTCFERMVLLEEGTGTWCAWCPGGQYGVELLHEKYAGQFVDVAVHINDQMSVKEYVDGTRHFFAGGIPSCTMNRSRSLIGHPYEDGDALMQQALQMGSVGKISCEASVGDDNKVTINAVAEFGVPITENAYTLSFIIVEDKMTGYEQSNIYGGSSMVMGGLENLPDPIPAGEYFFANVGRAIYPSYKGDSEAFPVGTPRHTPIAVTRTYDLPELQDIDNLKVVAIINDVASGEVVNVCEVKPALLSIEETLNDCGINIYDCGSAIAIEAQSIVETLQVYSLDGAMVYTASPAATAHCTTTLNPGLYIIKATLQAGQSATAKVIVR